MNQCWVQWSMHAINEHTSTRNSAPLVICTGNPLLLLGSRHSVLLDFTVGCKQVRITLKVLLCAVFLYMCVGKNIHVVTPRNKIVYPSGLKDDDTLLLTIHHYPGIPRYLRYPALK